MFDAKSKVGWEGAQTCIKKIMQKVSSPAMKRLQLEINGHMEIFNMIPAEDCEDVGAHPSLS